MSIRISLIDPPEFYTNLDVIAGRILLNLARPETVGAIIVKFEGESRTALCHPDSSSPGFQNNPSNPHRIGISQQPGSTGEAVQENHKILYLVNVTFPGGERADGQPSMLPPGQHEFPFRFKVPFNNSCSDPDAFKRTDEALNPGGKGMGLLGMGGVRLADHSKQLMYEHVTKTLPPSFTGFPRQAEIRYYIKVTIQRPGLFKENWRYQLGLKFLPIEPPRPITKNQEAYARRPFEFRPPSPAPGPRLNKRTSIFGSLGSSRTNSSSTLVNTPPTPTSPHPNGSQTPALSPDIPPKIEMSARLPHPSILTCNTPLPLRLISRKLSPSTAQVFLTSLQIELVGLTHVRCQTLTNTETTRWVILSRPGLSIPLNAPDAPVGEELLLPDALWKTIPLPNTVMPTFRTCNLGREYSLELKLSLSTGDRGIGAGTALKKKGKSTVPQGRWAQTLHLPLSFSSVTVFSGLTPPDSVLAAVAQHRASQTRPRPASQSQSQSQPLSPTQPDRPPPQPPRPRPAKGDAVHAVHEGAPPLPVRRPTGVVAVAVEDDAGALYPPQLPAGATAPMYDDAPPSYDEAMAQGAGPVMGGRARPAWSGVTDTAAPSSIPEKGG